MSDIEFEKKLKVEETGIAGLKVVDLSVHGDSRGTVEQVRQRWGWQDLRGLGGSQTEKRDLRQVLPL